MEGETLDEKEIVYAHRRVAKVPAVHKKFKFDIAPITKKRNDDGNQLVTKTAPVKILDED